MVAKQIPVTKRASQIEYAIRDVVVPATALEAQGHEIIKLNIGDPLAYPGLPTPNHMIEAYHQALIDQKNGYSPAYGISELREAIANNEQKKVNGGWDCQADNVYICQGVTEALQIIFAVFLNEGDINYVWKRPKDEWQAISLNYTSGTTGNPKGVVYHHRGSYLMATGSAAAWSMPNRLNFLYTVPMFHCNGWCYPWTLAMLHARVICIRNIKAKEIFDLITEHKVTHFGGAPIILNMLVSAPKEEQKPLTHKVYVLTAAAPPPSIIFKKMKNLGFEVMLVYGLTETYGHILQCAWN